MKTAYVLLLILFLPINAFADDQPSKTATAIFAGGCFWCMEPPFDKLPGVKKTVSGYIGGHIKSPTYKQVSSGSSGHYEALKVTYDSSKVSYQQLLATFWKNIDPLDNRGQFCDKGPQYLSAIFYSNKQQKLLAEQSLQKMDKQHQFDAPIATAILPADKFYPAESYHQNYYLKNPRRYKFYRWNCGRDQRLDQLWGTNTH